jgi:hypothetical protein
VEGSMCMGIVTDLDIYRTAQLLLRQHGADAAIHSAMRHDALLEGGDLDGAAVWKRVLVAIDVLLVNDRPEHHSLQ